MTARWMKSEDLERLKQIHAAMGFAYELPDPKNKNVVAKFVAEENGCVVAAVLGRRTAEAYFLLDRSWATPARRYEAFLELHNRACEAGALLGFEDVNVFLPPEVELSFGKRLGSLGWRIPEWHCYTRDI